MSGTNQTMATALGAARESAREGTAACQRIATCVKDVATALAGKKAAFQAPHLKGAWDEVAKIIDLVGTMKESATGLSHALAKAEQALEHALAGAKGGDETSEKEGEQETEQKKAPSHLIPDLAKVKAGKQMFFLLVKDKAGGLELETGPSRPAVPKDTAKVATGIILFDGVHIFETKNVSEVKAGVRAVFKEHKISLPFNVRVKAKEDEGDEGEDEEKKEDGKGHDAEHATLERIAALKPEVERLVAGGKPSGDALGKVFALIVGLAQAKDFVKAGAALDRIGPVLEKARADLPKGATPEPQKGKGVSSVAFTKTRLEWVNARKQMATELAKLVGAIKAGAQGEDPDGAFGPDAVAEAVEALHDVMENLDARLIDKLDEALVAKTQPERAARQVEARAIVGEYLDYLDGEPTLQDLDDGSGFGSFAVVRTARAALAHMGKDL